MVTEQTIRNLLHKADRKNVTISLPTAKVGPDRQQNPIRFKNLLNDAEKQLISGGMKSDEAESFLQPAKKLLDEPRFWSAMEYGLVIYLAPGYFDVFRLPYSVDEMVYVNTEFRITPLLPMTSTSGSFCILAVSLEKPRLLRCTRDRVDDITPAEAPGSIKQWLDEKPEQQVQFHTGNKEGEGAMYFGHGATDEQTQKLIENYLRELEKPMSRALNRTNDPMVLIGLTANLAAYRKANRYYRTMDQEIRHNPDDLSDRQLRDKGWNIVRDHFLGDMYKALELFRKSPSDKVSRDPTEIITATVMGKSDTLFIHHNAVRWGRYDESRHEVLYHDKPAGDDVDLMNWLSIRGLQTGSNVYILGDQEMPDQAEVAAVFRF